MKARSLLLFLGLSLASGAAPTAAMNPAPGTGSGVPCKTTVPGGLVAPGTVWGAAGSPYCVTGDIQVSLLTIEAGVCVEFQGHYKMDVLTSITVNGTSSNPVTFTSPAGTPWKGVRFNNTGPGSSFRGTVFENANRSAVVILNAGTPTFEDCVFRNNSNGAGYGGAINADGAIGDLVLTDCEFTGNSATDNGGAVRANLAAGSLKCTSTNFRMNTANSGYATGNRVGGAIWIQSGDSDFKLCEFEGNRSNARCASTFECYVTARGGAIFFGGSGTANLENSSFLSNIADARNNGNCFFGGWSRSYGDGIYVAGGTVDLTNCVLSCNRSVWTPCTGNDRAQGGGLYVNGGVVTVDQCTVVRNPNATGLHHAGGTLTVTNSIVYWNNSNGTQIGGMNTTTYSCVQGAAPMNGNIPFAPALAGVGCGSKDVSIVRGSPCIDAGDPLAAGDTAFPPSWGDATPDMGANGGPLAEDWASGLTMTPTSPAMLSVSSGGTATFNVDAGPEHAGKFFLLMGSATGFAPGFEFGGVCFPLVIDNYFDKTIGNAQKARLMHSFGFLDADGKPNGSAPTVTVPPGFNRLVGLQVYYAYVVVTPGAANAPHFVSNPVAMELAP